MRKCKSDGALGDDPLLEVLRCGGLHLVVTQVEPGGNGVNRNKECVHVLFSIGESHYNLFKGPGIQTASQVNLYCSQIIQSQNV